MSDPMRERERMVERHLRARGIRDELVLEAFRTVPREEFVPPSLAEFAYADTALPIGEEQTISQPYVVALTVAALRLKGGERVLEIGTGSGYAAAILGRIAGEVVTVERLQPLAEEAKERLSRLGFSNVSVHLGDGTRGWDELAPYDAIAVAAGDTEVPPSLRTQLAIGGRLVIPVGAEESLQVLMRITRVSEDEYDEEPLEEVRFVPLVGGPPFNVNVAVRPITKTCRVHPLAMLVREVAEPLTEIGNIDALIDRIGDSRVVLLGEATHGTSEFYRMRAQITKELILRRGFSFVAMEADWPDAARIDDYVRGAESRSFRWSPFSRFPTWMWRNQEFAELVEWLRSYNADTPLRASKVGVHGLDLYSLFTSMNAVLDYLDRVDPAAASVARVRYGRLTPWQKDPAAYGLAVLNGKYESSENDVMAMLRDMLEKRAAYAESDPKRFFDATQNAKVVAAAEQYYRAMYYGAADSWNLRDRHMFETLESLFALHGPNAKGIVWAHNSHVGDASATEMALHGELNIGQLCRKRFGDRAFLVGFGTDHGSVVAAADWGEPMQTMRVRAAHRRSYEHVFHESGVAAFLLALRSPAKRAIRDELMAGRLERAIGVVYRPDTEIASHYLEARLPEQFDEYVWFDETSAILPLRAEPRPTPGLPETYPFGL